MSELAHGWPLQPADLAWSDDDTPLSSAFGDVYFSREGGFAESEHVLLEGNDLSSRFAAGQGARLLETGFGTGRNFLTTALLFLETAPAGATLDFVSLERHPIAAGQLPRLAQSQRRLAERWLSGHPWLTCAAGDRLLGLQSSLYAEWPDPVPGFHRRVFAGGRIRLTMIWGDASRELPRLAGPFDAFYLDGFAPDRNPELWQEALIGQLAGKAAPGATAATYSAARRVRDALERAGFACEKRPGFGRKRDMLSARFAGVEPPNPPRHTAPLAVIGAGMAGATVARSLARRGREVMVFEAGRTPAGGGSGNPAGLVAPVISRDWNRLSQLTATGMGVMRAELGALVDGHTAAFDGVIKLARSERHAARQAGIAAELEPDPGFAQWCGPERLRALTGLAEIESSGWWFPTAGWLRPRAVIDAWLSGPCIETRFDASVGRLRGEPGAWWVETRDGRRHGPFAEVIVAAGPASGKLLEGLARWIEPCRGQVSWGQPVDADASPTPGRPLMREGYALDLPGGERLFGASFLPGDEGLELREAEHAENRARLEAITPSLARGVEGSRLEGRASLRATTPDRLPIVGSLAEGLWVSTGHGARGLTWSALLAEYLASAIEGTPLPLPIDLAEGLRPGRFDERAARRAARRQGG